MDINPCRSLIRRAVALALAAALTAACGATGLQTSGFLDDYTLLAPNPQYQSKLIWVDQELDLANFDQLMIDPVEVQLHPRAYAAIVKEETLASLAANFHSRMVAEVDPYYTVVDEPGEGVMRIRIALTDVIPADEGPQMGGATMEAEILDSASGARLIALVDEVRGMEVEHVSEARWKHAEGAFQTWAARLLAAMNQAHELE